MKTSYGWVIVAAGFAITCMGMGSMMALGVFLQPISTEMGWSRAGVSAASMLNFLCMGAASFMWGALSDRFGTRFVVLCCGVILGLGLTLASQAGSLIQFQLLFGGIVGVGAGGFYAPLMAVTARWFTKHRSLAVALVSAGMSVGSASMSPLARWLISAQDWRSAMLIMGILAWGTIIPLGLLIRRPPIQTAEALASASRGFTVAGALRTPQFAAIALTHFACCAAHSGPIFHMVSYAIDCGIPGMTAATFLSAAGLSALTGRIICGLAADRIGAQPTLVAGLAVQAAAISLYLLAGGIGSFYALSALFGFAYGGVMPLYAILVREYFGARIMGSVFGAVASVSTLGMAIGPLAGGIFYDRFGGYSWLYIGSCAFGVGAIAIAVTCRPPRRPDITLADGLAGA